MIISNSIIETIQCKIKKEKRKMKIESFGLILWSFLLTLCPKESSFQNIWKFGFIFICSCCTQTQWNIN